LVVELQELLLSVPFLLVIPLFLNISFIALWVHHAEYLRGVGLLEAWAKVIDAEQLEMAASTECD